MQRRPNLQRRNRPQIGHFSVTSCFENARHIGMFVSFSRPSPFCESLPPVRAAFQELAILFRKQQRRGLHTARHTGNIIDRIPGQAFAHHHLIGRERRLSSTSSDNRFVLHRVEHGDTVTDQLQSSPLVRVNNGHRAPEGFGFAGQRSTIRSSAPQIRQSRREVRQRPRLAATGERKCGIKSIRGFPRFSFVES